MQSRIPTLVTVTAAAALGSAVGISYAASTDLDISAMVTPDTLASSVMTGLALFTIRRWLAGFDARTRATLSAVAAQQLAIEDQQAANEHALKERAAAVSREAAAAEDKVRAISARLDALAEGRAADLEKLEELRRTNAEVLAEYNALVRETIQAGAAQFARKDCHQAAGPRLLHATELLPEPRGEAHPAADNQAPAPAP